MTSIEWTDRVWNPVTGCTKVSAGCRNCYAEGIAHRFWGDRKFTDVRTHEDRLDAPLRWRKPQRVFVNSMSDLFHDDVPDEFIDRVFAVMAYAQRHTFQVLTKRPQRMLRYCGTARSERSRAINKASREMFGGVVLPTQADGMVPGDWPLPNVWLGTSVEDQRAADERIPLLLQTPAAVRFLSCEPLLGPIRFSRVPGAWGGVLNSLHWVIVGGESGPGSRPCDEAWIRSIVEQCEAANVPAFVKQLGAKPMAQIQNEDRHGVAGSPLQAAWRAASGGWPMDLRDRKGGDPSEWPADLRVRQFPDESEARRGRR